MCEQHNGYTNYQTWAVSLYIDNDRDANATFGAIAKDIKANAPYSEQVKAGIWTPDEAARFLLADELKNDFEEYTENLDLPSPYADLLSSALSAVNWKEVADSLLEEED